MGKTFAVDTLAPASMARRNADFAWLVDNLADAHGPPPAPFPAGAFELVLWENIAYLADDGRRREAFDTLRKTVGTRPGDILGATRSELAAVARQGILPDRTVQKLHRAAKIAVDKFDGDVDALLDRPVEAAKKALRRFPGVGEPAAEKILLFTRRHPFLAPDSNALRVLVRFGVCHEGRDYRATYAAARAAAQSALGPDFDLLLAARHDLRRHGQEVCRRSKPLCADCVVRSRCPSRMDLS